MSQTSYSPWVSFKMKLHLRHS